MCPETPSLKRSAQTFHVEGICGAKLAKRSISRGVPGPDATVGGVSLNGKPKSLAPQDRREKHGWPTAIQPRIKNRKVVSLSQMPALRVCDVSRRGSSRNKAC